MHPPQLLDKRLHGLCCWRVMKLDTGAFLVLYVDLAGLTCQLAYMAASILIQCCTVSNFIWFLLCVIQSVFCVLLFRAISGRDLNLLRVYIAIGILGRGVIVLIWTAVILLGGFVRQETFQDSQLVLIGFLLSCLAIICFCGVVLIKCYLYFKELHQKLHKCRQHRQFKLCPHRDHMYRENSGLLSHSTSNGQNFLLHELDLERLEKNDDEGSRPRY